MSEVDLGEYMIFCKDFKIPLQKSKLTEIFKKASSNHKTQKFEQFFASMARIGQEINRLKLEEVNLKLKEINKALRKNNNNNDNSRVDDSVVVSQVNLNDESQIKDDNEHFDLENDNENLDKNAEVLQEESPKNKEESILEKQVEKELDESNPDLFGDEEQEDPAIDIDVNQADIVIN